MVSAQYSGALEIQLSPFEFVFITDRMESQNNWLSATNFLSLFESPAADM